MMQRPGTTLTGSTPTLPGDCGRRTPRLRLAAGRARHLAIPGSAIVLPLPIGWPSSFSKPRTGLRLACCCWGSLPRGPSRCRGPFPASLVYTVCLVLAYGWYLWAYWRRYEHRFHDYRALAEGLRVQMYWNAAGITACAADHYLRRQRSEFEWIRQALRAWTLPLQACHGSFTCGRCPAAPWKR